MNWTEPIAISPFDHNVVYTASQYVHKTSDGGQTWKIISPDLTLNDKKMMGNSGGLTIDNLSVEYSRGSASPLQNHHPVRRDRYGPVPMMGSCNSRATVELIGLT